MSWEEEDWEAYVEPESAVVSSSTPGPAEEGEDNIGTGNFSDEEEIVSSEDEDALGALEQPKARNEEKDAAKAMKPKKKSKKQEEEEKRRLEEIEAAAAAKRAEMSQAEIVAEKLRLQKIVELADNKLTEELFGVANGKSDVAKEHLQAAPVVSLKEHMAAKQAPVVSIAAKPGKPAPVISLSAGPSKVAEVELTGEELVLSKLKKIPLGTATNYNILASALAKRLQGEKKTKDFIKELLRVVEPQLQYEDIVEIDALTTSMKTTKAKSQGKKKKGGKISANVMRDGDYDDYTDSPAVRKAVAYEDEYDFM